MLLPITPVPIKPKVGLLISIKIIIKYVKDCYLLDHFAKTGALSTKLYERHNDAYKKNPVYGY